jgi:hypothetical protein
MNVEVLNTIIPTDSGEIKRGAYFNFENSGKIWVYDAGNIQNPKLFEKGLKLIFTKVNESRANYLLALIDHFSKLGEDKYCTEQYCHFLALICDIALHDKPKLAHSGAYDKAFNRYVANLFYHYYIDDAFEVWKSLGCNALVIPEFLMCDKNN